VLGRLFSRSKNADQRLREVMHEHHDFVWRSLRRLGVREADTDDATQEVFLIFAKRLEEVTVELTRAFLFGTASRVASNRRRGRQRLPEEPLSSIHQLSAPSLDPEELSELSLARAQLQGILEAMSLEQRTVFVLCDLEELTAPAAAELLAVPVGTVSSRLRGAREVFRSAVHRLGVARRQRRSGP
jgi:RNA polymerase sigma-70 factor (ECF subfamily)